jgi:hypothetical protein
MAANYVIATNPTAATHRKIANRFMTNLPSRLSEFCRPAQGRL